MTSHLLDSTVYALLLDLWPSPSFLMVSCAGLCSLVVAFPEHIPLFYIEDPRGVLMFY